MIAHALDQIERNGYAVVQASDVGPLARLRNALFAEARRLCGADSNDPDAFMNGFHKRNLRGPELNDFRLKLIREMNEKTDCGGAIFDAFRGALIELVGPDIAVQKSCNLVIQQPGDEDVSPIHRDSPPNSPFEIVLWIPLVNCYGTKGMSVLDVGATQEVVADIAKSGATDADAAYAKAGRLGSKIEADFGSALFFWAGLMHVIPVNSEFETRWSLNIRYKNLFSPYGEKKLPDFFRILQTSALTKLAFDRDRRALGLDSNSNG